VPTAFQGSKCVRGELKPRNYQVRARYQVRANALLYRNVSSVWRGAVVPALENNIAGGGGVPAPGVFVYREIFVWRGGG